jgi:hypothetical protein
MPNDLTIMGAGNPVASPDWVQTDQPGSTPNGEPKGVGPPLPNPTLRLDAGLGIVVIEFRNSAGEVASTIPTERQLEAYRYRSETAPPPAPRASSPSPPKTTGHPPGRAAAPAPTPPPRAGKPGIVA